MSNLDNVLPHDCVHHEEVPCQSAALLMLPSGQHRAGGTPNGLSTTLLVAASGRITLPRFSGFSFFFFLFLSPPQDERNLEEVSLSLGLSLLFLTL